MSIGPETDALMSLVMASAFAETALVDGGPASIRVLFDEPFLAQVSDSGMFANTEPQGHIRESDCAGLTPEVTELTIRGVEYTINRLEPESGGNWRTAVLNRTA